MKKVVSAAVVSAIIVGLFAFPVRAQKLGRSVDSKRLSPQAETRFASFSAYSDGIRGVWLEWGMVAEVENIGFRVYRVGKNGAELLSPEQMTAGSAMRAREIPEFGTTYNYYDRGADLDSAYYVQALSLSGAKLVTKQIYPEYVSDLSSVTGLSSDEVDRRGRQAFARLESNRLNIPKELASEIAQNRLLADPATHRAVISQPGVRFGVKREGIYRVTRAQLQAAGFNVNSDPAMWQLYAEGAEQAMIIGNNADYIEFYGKGVDTRETDIRTYFLIVGGVAGKRMATRSARPPTSTVITPSYSQTYVKKERTQYVEDILNGDAENYWGRGIGSTATTVNFTLTGVDFGATSATLYAAFMGYSGGSHVMEITLNDVVLTPANGFGGAPYSASYSLPITALREGANTIRFRGAGPAGDFSFFDQISIRFNRKYLAEANRAVFYTDNLRTARLDGFSSPNVRVFDLTYDGAPILLTNLNFQQNGTVYGADIPAYRPRSYFAVEDSAVFAPDSVTPNNPQLISDPATNGTLVIISYRDFMAQAETWANYRRAQGVTVKVIEVSEIFDEYNYGQMSSASIKAFLQEATQVWNTPPQYVLFIGDGSWDSRNYEGVGFFNFVPPAMVSTAYMETASDEALADFNNDGFSELAIGRISSRTATGVQTVFNKVVQFEALTGDPLARGGLFAYDHNSGYDFAQMSNSLRNQIPSMPSTLVYRGQANANATLISEMNTGKYLINYSGHGTPGSWGGNPLFFNVFSVPTLSEHNPSVYTMLTCLNGYFHWLYNPSFAEVLTLAENKGAVAAWGSTGKTTPDLQEIMATRFYRKVGEGDIPRLGDLVKDAKGSLIDAGADVRLSWALIGDPMLKVR